MKKMRYVLVQEKFGIFVGLFQGDWCWSIISNPGYVTAPALTREELDGLLNHLSPHPDLTLPYGVLIEVAGEEATIPELQAAGLGYMLGDMLVNAPSTTTIQ